MLYLCTYLFDITFNSRFITAAFMNLFGVIIEYWTIDYTIADVDLLILIQN